MDLGGGLVLAGKVLSSSHVPLPLSVRITKWRGGYECGKREASGCLQQRRLLAPSVDVRNARPSIFDLRLLCYARKSIKEAGSVALLSFPAKHCRAPEAGGECRGRERGGLLSV